MSAELPIIKTGLSVSKRFISTLPKWLLRRVLKPDSIRNEITLRLADGYGIELVKTAVPSVVIRLWLYNLSPLPLTIDRIHFCLWVGQPVIKEDYLRRIELKPYNQHFEHISFNLSETELAVVKSGLDEHHRTKPGHQVRLETEVVCDTGIGRITRLDGIDYNGEISRG